MGLSSKTTLEKEWEKKKPTSSYKIHFSNHTYARWADQWVTLYLFFSRTTLSHHPVWFLRHHSNCPRWKAFIGVFDLGNSRKLKWRIKSYFLLSLQFAFCLKTFVRQKKQGVSSLVWPHEIHECLTRWDCLKELLRP